MRTRVEIVQAALRRRLLDAAGPRSASAGDEPLTPGAPGLTARRGHDLLEDMLRSRSLDVAARRLKASGASYYTISSAGHEVNAVIGAVTRPSDPAFLHYRSGGFVMARARQVEGTRPVRDTILSFMAAEDDPIAHGRHKVWGSAELWIPPQTSTIASHLPKAVGTAFAIERAGRLGHRAHSAQTPDVPDDAIVIASVGDASANHASALAGVNAARYAHRRGARAPILIVIEDNGRGISVETPKRWVEGLFQGLPHLGYMHADGPIDAVWQTVEEAVARVRTHRAPMVLHLPTVRLWGHAGSDVEATYRPQSAIESDEARDPLAAAGERLIALGALTSDEAALLQTEVDVMVQDLADHLVGSPTLPDRTAVMAPLSPHDADEVTAQATGALPAEARDDAWGDDPPEKATAPARRTMAAHINAALHDEMLRRPETIVFGEDVGAKGGVYHVTAGLHDRFGSDRVFDTLLDETTILGVAQGAGMLGFLPIPEIQYLAYIHNALDQVRGEAASLAFFSAGQFTNPMVIRIAGLAYQKGFGGHFHNDNAIGALRDIPGLAIACPSRGDEAARMLRTAIGMAAADGNVVAFLEPIALYHEKDLHTDGDGAWLFDYPPPGAPALLPGDLGIYDPPDGSTPDVLLVSYANGLRMSMQAARRLAIHGVSARVIDLRWLAPLPAEAVAEHVAECGRALFVDECRQTGGGVADALIAEMVERDVSARMRSVRAADSFVPLGPAADHVLVSTDQIVEAALALRDQ